MKYTLRWVVQHTWVHSYLVVQIHLVIQTVVTGIACAWPAPPSNSQPCRTAIVTPYMVLLQYNVHLICELNVTKVILLHKVHAFHCKVMLHVPNIHGLVWRCVLKPVPWSLVHDASLHIQQVTHWHNLKQVSHKRYYMCTIIASECTEIKQNGTPAHYVFDRHTPINLYVGTDHSLHSMNVSWTKWESVNTRCTQLRNASYKAH